MNVRTPEEILKAMETPSGQQPNPVLLQQLDAELQVSISQRNELTSKRNLRIANISCIVAVIALIIALLQLLSSRCC